MSSDEDDYFAIYDMEKLNKEKLDMKSHMERLEEQHALKESKLMNIMMNQVMEKLGGLLEVTGSNTDKVKLVFYVDGGEGSSECRKVILSLSFETI